MRLDMIDSHKRRIGCKGQCLGRPESDQKRTDQTGLVPDAFGGGELGISRPEEADALAAKLKLSTVRQHASLICSLVSSEVADADAEADAFGGGLEHPCRNLRIIRSGSAAMACARTPLGMGSTWTYPLLSSYEQTKIRSPLLKV